MSEELKCPYCEGTASIAYNNLLYCHDCKRTFSERDAKIMKQAARIAELEDTVRKLTGRERILGDETILYAAHKETIAYKDKQIAKLEAERDRLREALQGLMQAVDGCLTPHEALLWKNCEEALKGAGE